MSKDPIPAPCFLGVEGGGTRTVAILADGRDQVMQRLETGPTNISLLTDRQLFTRLQELANQLPVPSALCIGLAGVRTDEDRARVIAAASQVWPGLPCHPCADLETALAAAPLPPERVGAQVLVLSGTGSCCYGRAENGTIAKMGGWGHVLGDKGSGYEIGLRALKAVLYYYDRDGTWPALGQQLLRALQLNAPDDLIGWVQSAEKKDVAALAIEVFSAWEQRDPIASDILAAAAEGLAKDAASCAKRLVRSSGLIQFIFAGSVLLKQPRFGRTVRKRLALLWPESLIVPLQAEGALGAARLARQMWSREESHDARRAQPRTGPPGRVGRSSSGGRGVIAIPESIELSPTERRNPRSRALDKLPLGEAVSLMLAEEARLPSILLQQRGKIVRCIGWITQSLRRGGRLFYVGAGTSGRLGALDASECPPTFRVRPEQVQGIIAGGQQALWQSIEGAEDDAAGGASAIRFRGVSARDVVVGIAASGRTPFVWGAIGEAKRAGAKTVLVCFNPYLRIARGCGPGLVIASDLGPEVLTGSTRLKAGTATKLLLNLFTTLSMVRLGKVVSNLMVDLNPSNSKLRDRAVRIMRELTGMSDDEARHALESSGWVIKRALARCGRRPVRAGH